MALSLVALQVEADGRRSVHWKVKQLTWAKSSPESSMSPFPFSLPLIKMKKWKKSSPNRMNRARGDT